MPLGSKGIGSAFALRCSVNCGPESRGVSLGIGISIGCGYLALSRLVVWPYTNEAAEQFGRVFAELRRIGRPMRQIDIMVAAIAFSLGNCTVVSKDSDLSAVPGLRVENWATSDA